MSAEAHAAQRPTATSLEIALLCSGSDTMAHCVYTHNTALTMWATCTVFAIYSGQEQEYRTDQTKKLVWPPEKSRRHGHRVRISEQTGGAGMQPVESKGLDIMSSERQRSITGRGVRLGKQCVPAQPISSPTLLQTLNNKERKPRTTRGQSPIGP